MPQASRTQGHCPGVEGSSAGIRFHDHVLANARRWEAEAKRLSTHAERRLEQVRNSLNALVMEPDQAVASIAAANSEYGRASTTLGKVMAAADQASHELGKALSATNVDYIRNHAIAVAVATAQAQAALEEFDN